MVPGDGKNPSEKIKKDLIAKLKSFGIHYEKHTVNSTLDGCNTNKKLARLMKKLLQLCLAHGVQLGVVKTLYVATKNKDTTSSGLELASTNDDEIESDHEEMDESDTVDMDNNSEEEYDENDLEDENDEHEDSDIESEDLTGLFDEEIVQDSVLLEKFEEVINKLRKIVKTHHGRSNVRVHQLQEAIKAWQKKHVS